MEPSTADLAKRAMLVLSPRMVTTRKLSVLSTAWLALLTCLAGTGCGGATMDDKAKCRTNADCSQLYCQSCPAVECVSGRCTISSGSIGAGGTVASTGGATGVSGSSFASGGTPNAKCPMAAPTEGYDCYLGGYIGTNCAYDSKSCTCVNEGQNSASWHCISLRDAGSAVDSGFLCGTENCGSNQLCVHQACGGGPSQCVPLGDGGQCPAGWTYTASCPPTPTGYGCEPPPCTDPPPICANVPAVCLASPLPGLDCSCADSICGSGQCQQITGRDVTCGAE